MDLRTDGFTIKNAVLLTYDGPGGDVDIPAGIIKIKSWAFAGHTGLTSVSIPKGVTDIGICAFHDCAGLESISIPDTVSHIGRGAFYGCPALKSIYVPAYVTMIGKLAFDAGHGLVIHAPAGSRAELYALTNGIAFEAT